MSDRREEGKGPGGEAGLGPKLQNICIKWRAAPLFVLPFRRIAIVLSRELDHD